MSWVAISKLQVASGEHSGNHKCASFNSIRNDAVPRAVELFYTMNTDSMRSCAFNPGSHFGEQRSQIHNFRLTRAVFHDGFAFSQCCRHHEVFSAGNGKLV